MWAHHIQPHPSNANAENDDGIPSVTGVPQKHAAKRISTKQQLRKMHMCRCLYAVGHSIKWHTAEDTRVTATSHQHQGL
jgi:hypothetical protein